MALTTWHGARFAACRANLSGTRTLGFAGQTSRAINQGQVSSTGDGWRALNADQISSRAFFMRAINSPGLNGLIITPAPVRAAAARNSVVIPRAVMKIAEAISP